MAKLAPICQELADLQIKEVEAHVDAQEDGEKLVALLQRMHMDEAEAEQLQKEQDDLLQTIQGFRMERDLAHQERADA